MNKIFILCLFCFFWLASGIAQKESNYKGKYDLGINATSVLSSFSGNGSFLEPENLPVFIRLTKRQPYIRIGLGANSSSSEFFDIITNVNRTSIAQEFYAKVGFELNSKITKRWTAFYGVDLIGNYELDKVLVDNVDSITKRRYSPGLSAFFGYKFFITDRLYLSTEANLSLLFDFEVTRQTNQPNADSSGESFFINPPLFFYFNYRL